MSPSLNVRSTPQRWSAWSAPRCGAGAGNTRPARSLPISPKAKACCRPRWTPAISGRSSCICRSSSLKRPIPARRSSDASRTSRFHIRICWRRFIRTTGQDVLRCLIWRSRPAATTASSTATPGPAVRGPDGSLKSLVGVCSDITARKVAEIEREALLAQLAAERTALAELTATLEQRVEQRTADLMKEVAAREKAQEQLRQAQKMETIGQLTGGVAHDFNNLLMAVMGNLDLLRKRLPNDPRLHRLIDGALQGAERGASLTHRLLAFARQQDLRAVPVDLRVLIQGMSDLLQRSLGPRVALRLELPEGLPPARVDANQLELAVLNLAINARDAMPDGGSIEIKVCEHQASGDPALKSGRYLKLSVIDTGKGMTPDILKRAMEPFFSSKPLGKGTGLGLSMVHGLAVQLGGALQLTSAVAKGTNATLVLPIATSAPEAQSPVLKSHKVNRSAVILFVDDDPLIAMSTTEMLEDLGHQVIGASSGLHALDIIRSEQPIDLMMTDHVMPGMTGIELAAASPRVRHSLPILLATGYAELPDGAQPDLPRLAKPYHQDQLRDRLDQLLG